MVSESCFLNWFAVSPMYVSFPMGLSTVAWWTTFWVRQSPLNGQECLSLKLHDFSCD